MLRLLVALSLAFFALTLPAHAATEASILNPSGMPVPRFVSLKSDEVNMRVGPGKRYPIRFTYRRAHLPVQIIEEFAHWRKIRDFEGSTGWVHKNTLDGKRTVIVVDKPQHLYRRPSTESSILMRANPRVLGKLLACNPDWCQVEIERRRAWIRKTDIWGVTREEVFTP